MAVGTNLSPKGAVGGVTDRPHTPNFVSPNDAVQSTQFPISPRTQTTNGRNYPGPLHLTASIHLHQLKETHQTLPVPELDLWVTSRPVFVPYTLSFVVSPVTLLSLLSLFFTNVLSGEESNLTSGAGEDDLAAKR
ncbi:hypothetical protein V6N12_015654 [Hibiscus sabdariffa]|uniref:Uncharacterized protein n=1 Tax=Hibiscus sabdariffa TaxID=183260 RepID=A0ABR2DNT1_9ROSI